MKSLIVRLVSSVALLVSSFIVLAPAAHAFEWECLEFDKYHVVTTSQGDYTLPTCATFYDRGAAIHLPADNATTKYGVLFDTAGFFDRFGNNYGSDVTLGLAPRVAGAIIVKATMSSNRVSAAEPVLEILPAAVLKRYTGKAFIGLVKNLNPPANVKHYPWFQMDFYQRIRNGRVFGEFLNYRVGIRWNHMKHCRYGVMRTAAEHRWYRPIIGPTNKVSLSWNPAMHATDSELTLTFSSGVSYMRALPPTASLLRRNLKSPGLYEFTIHGNPVGTPAVFSGQWLGVMNFHYCN